MFLTWSVNDPVEVPPEGATAPPPPAEGAMAPPPRPPPRTRRAPQARQARPQAGQTALNQNLPAVTAAIVAVVGPPETWPAPARKAVGLSPRSDLKACTKCGRFTDLTTFIHANDPEVETKQCQSCRTFSNVSHAKH
ncbi:hypothetical protein N7540_007561 [Penicillium herquei]|nr:hypothetical protein N7540_007561 [Penicillium herquei]